MPKTKRILCPTDYTSASDDALRYAVSMAMPLHAKLTILHVRESQNRDVQSDRNGDHANKAGQHSINSMPVEAVVEVEYVYRDGDPAQEIVKTAREMSVDQIVIGSHGRQRRHRVDRGNTAEQIVNDSPCAVTVVSNVDVSQ